MQVGTVCLMGCRHQMNCASEADAAVAISAALNVTEPSSCGLGGCTLCYLHHENM